MSFSLYRDQQLSIHGIQMDTDFFEFLNGNPNNFIINWFIQDFRELLILGKWNPFSSCRSVTLCTPASPATRSTCAWSAASIRWLPAPLSSTSSPRIGPSSCRRRPWTDEQSDRARTFGTNRILVGTTPLRIYWPKKLAQKIRHSHRVFPIVF